MIVRDPSRRGKPLDVALMMRYRVATGQEKRILLDQLLWENEPLVTVLVDQLCGRGAPKRGAVKLAGCEGFADIPWEDAKQAGLMALMKAMDSYDPTKGKLPYHLLLKCRYECQCIIEREGLARVARGKTGIAFDLVGEQRDMDAITVGHHEDGLVTSDEFSAEDVRRWQETGHWPENVAEASEDVACARASAAEMARNREQQEQARRDRAMRQDPLLWLGSAMYRLFLFRPFGRIETYDAYNRYRIDCRAHLAEELDRRSFVRTLCDTGKVREAKIRDSGRSSTRGLAGMLSAIAQSSM